MVLLQIDPQRIAIVKLEGYAPRAVHMDRVARRFRTMQGVKVKSGDVHVLGLFSVVQSLKSGEDATDKPSVDLG